MDRKYIETEHIVDRYLSGDLTVREAREFEKYCLDHPEALKAMPIPVRLKARLSRRPRAGQRDGRVQGDSFQRDPRCAGSFRRRLRRRGRAARVLARAGRRWQPHRVHRHGVRAGRGGRRRHRLCGAGEFAEQAGQGYGARRACGADAGGGKHAGLSRAAGARQAGGSRRSHLGWMQPPQCSTCTSTSRKASTTSS